MVELSWDGETVPVIAYELCCSEKTVRRWLHRFNQAGHEGLEDLGGQGRKPRITQVELSHIIALASSAPPGRLEVQPDGELEAADESGPPLWTLDTLAQVARQDGIEIGRSQVRRILLDEGVRWRHTRSWTRSQDPDSRDVAFLDRWPPLPGKVLVAPKQHVEHVVRDLDEPAYVRLMLFVRRVALTMEQACGPERTYIYSLGSQQGNAHLNWRLQGSRRTSRTRSSSSMPS
ncbi:helix-turn-helix domain-containing protein [Streptomyces aureoversilis]|uniref:Helix-turn-helix domain-containing protein n=1 Tax=Streptomyces aureoversilis TaxID=67277 RepID=A0ABV9ZVA5_9ACTN